MTAYSNIISLYLEGPRSINNNVSLYAEGPRLISSGISLFVEGSWGNVLRSSGVPLYTLGNVAYSGSLYLYIPVDSDIHNNVPLFLYNYTGSGVERGLKLYTINSDGITQGATNFSHQMTLYIARDTEGNSSSLSLFTKAIEGEPNSYTYLYISGDPTSLLNNNTSLYLSNMFGSGYNNIGLYTHGF